MESTKNADGSTGPIQQIDIPVSPTGSTQIGPESKVTPKSGEFDTLVLSGGSIQAMIILGALQYASDNFLLQKITTYIGASAGAICGYLLAIGYSPTEIMVYICTKQILERMKQFNIVAMINGTGATSFSYIHEELERMTIEKIGRLISLKDLYTLFGKTLICTTHNMTTNKLEILSHETYPDLPCLIALRMTSNLPFIFDHFRYMGNFYVDGGISNNYPIDIADEKGNKILGIVLHDISASFNNNNSNNIIEYFFQLISIPMLQNVVTKIENSSDKCTNILLKPGSAPFFNFSLDTHTKLEMFSDGYHQMEKLWSEI